MVFFSSKQGRNLIWLKLALREIRNRPQFSLFFIVNLALGLCGFIGLNIFEGALTRDLSARSKAVLGGDLSISGARPLNDTEREAIQKLLPDATITAVVEMYSMVASAKASRLIQLVAIDERFPLYGTLRLAAAGDMAEPGARRLDINEAWTFPEVLVQLGVPVGETIKIGETSFRISDTVEIDVGSSSSIVSLAPKIYISQQVLTATGLLQRGSRVSYRYLLRLPGDPDLKALVQSLRDAIGPTEMSIQSHVDASEALGRLLGYLTDYLGLVALVALFLASLGTAYLFRSFLLSRLHAIATMMSLGAHPRQAQSVYALQLALLGLVAGLGGILLSQLLLPWLPILLKSFMTTSDLQLALNARAVFLALVIGTVGSFLVCLPFLARIHNLGPAILFREQYAPVLSMHWRGFVWYMPAMAAFWLLAVWQAHSLKVGSLFFGGFLLAALLLAGAALAIFRLMEAVAQWFPITMRFAMRSITRNRLSSISCFLAIGLGTMLASLIPQLQASLQQEVSTPKGLKLPSLFLFDIQEEQLPTLQTLLANDGYQLAQISPLVRARLESINGVPIAEYVAKNKSVVTREDQETQRFLTRTYNLTFRKEFSPSETLIEGVPFTDESYNWDSEHPPKISLEYRFAERLKVGLNDLLGFDVQGVPVEGKVVSLRRVKWNSFQPNFFVQFQPGVFDDAPKTMLASISSLTSAQRVSIQNRIVERFPNISIVDVANAVERISAIVGQMSWALLFMAYLSLFAGLVVLYGIARQHAFTKRWDINLLKVLGADFLELRLMNLAEFGLLGGLAASIGVLASLLFNFAVAYFVFDGVWEFSWRVPLLILAIVVTLSILTAQMAVRKVLSESPAGLLKAGV